MGIEVVHIPAGCTYLCQPSNVRVNKPIKTHLHEKWGDRKTDGEGVEDGVTKGPSHKVVAEWFVETYSTMPATVGRNTWMMDDFEWF